MEIKNLKSFVSAATLKSFSAAARQLYISQPTISRQISDLEEELAVKLFIRTTHKVMLTDAGEVLLPEAVKILANDARVSNLVKGVIYDHTKTLRIGYLASACAGFLPQLINQFSQLDPTIEVTLKEMTSQAQLEGLLNNNIDIAFSRPQPQLIEKEYSSLDIYSDKLVALLPSNHNLAKKEYLRLIDLKDEKFILFKRDEAVELYDDIIKSCQKSGFSPQVTTHSENMRNLITTVSSGLGVSIVPYCTRHIGSSDCVFIPIIDLNITLQLKMYFETHTDSVHVTNFVDFISLQSKVIYQTLS